MITINLLITPITLSIVVAGGNATLCDLRLLVRAGRPYLFCNSVQSNNDQ